MGLVVLKKIENITDFTESEEKGLVSEIRAGITLYGYNDIIAKAKEIDKNNFNKECFGISFNYNHKENRLFILGENSSIYYVDESGNDNYFKISQININNLKRQIIMEIKKFLKNKDEYIEKNNIWYDKM